VKYGEQGNRSVNQRYALRPITAADHTWLRWLHHAAMRDVVERTWGWDEAQQDALFLRYFNPSSGSQIVQVEERDVGLLDVESREGELFLSEIWIAPEQQGQGIGTQLVRDLQLRAEKEGLDVTLQVLKLNERAQALYERLEFAVVGETATHRLMRWAYTSQGQQG
jgi:ribosomal protein S18 acetylase RimI-like enzyme